MSLQAAHGICFTLQNPSPGVVATLKPLPAFRNRCMGQEGMKLDVAGCSQKQLEVLLPPDVELQGEEDRVLWFPWAGCPLSPSSHVHRVGAGILGSILQDRVTCSSRQAKGFCATVLAINVNENSRLKKKKKSV